MDLRIPLWLIAPLLALVSLVALTACTCGNNLAADGPNASSAASTAAQPLTLDALGGKEWVLTHWALGEAVPATPEVTLSYLEGRFAGRGGCNNYFAGITQGPAPGELKTGPAGSTQMYCAGEAMSIEFRFLENLSSVTAFGFEGGKLALSYEKGGAVEVMLFKGRPLPEK